jgi:chemotaxis methyl-accepting protein methylase
VIIYFNKNLTSKVFDIFDRSLEQNGILVLGESENFDQLYNYHPIGKKQKIYLKGSQ